MDLKTRLEKQSALLDAHTDLFDKQQRYRQEYNEAMQVKDYDLAREKWAYYDGYSKAVTDLLNHLIKLNHPRQLELELDD